MTRPLRATHLITSLDPDGAQQVLLRLLKHLGQRAEAMDVVSMIPGGAIRKPMLDAGIPVQSLDISRRVPNPLAAWRLARWLRKCRSEVLVTWLYHADLLGTMAALLAGRLPLVWNVHYTSPASPRNKVSTRLIAAVCAKLAKRAPQCVVFCAESSRVSHVARGYPPDRAVVIPNGIDTDRFHPAPSARYDVRSELGIPGNAPLIGILGRYHPDKDHPTFFAAAARIAPARPDVHFLICGRGMDAGNHEIVAAIRNAGLAGRCHLLGFRTDIPRLAAALDLGVSSSVTEALSNAIGEMMSCGIPCVATDVGDSSMILGGNGEIVPPQDPPRLAEACLDLLARPLRNREQLGHGARMHIKKHFDLASTAQRHFDAWYSAARDTRRFEIQDPRNKQAA